MTSTHERCFAWTARDSAVPSILTMSDPAVFMVFGSPWKGIALAAAAPTVEVRNARRFRSVGSFTADLFYLVTLRVYPRSHVEGPLSGKPPHSAEGRLLGKWWYESPRDQGFSSVIPFSVCHTSCHTEFDSFSRLRVSSRFGMVGGTGIEPVAPAV